MARKICKHDDAIQPATPTRDNDSRAAYLEGRVNQSLVQIQHEALAADVLGQKRGQEGFAIRRGRDRMRLRAGLSGGARDRGERGTSMLTAGFGRSSFSEEPQQNSF